MKIEIDQSGKIENTNKPTVVGFSNKKNKTIIIFSTEKQKLQRYFRNLGKPKVYRYKLFAILIYFLLKDEKNLEIITIDKEYPGQENLIKSYLLEYLRKTQKNIDKKMITFGSIGKKSKAHEVTHKAYKKKRADIKISMLEIIKFLKQN